MPVLLPTFALMLALAGPGVSVASSAAHQLQARSDMAGGSSGGDDPGKSPLPWYMDPTKGGHKEDRTGRGVNFRKGTPDGDKGRSRVGKKGLNFLAGHPQSHGQRGRSLGAKSISLKAGMGKATMGPYPTDAGKKPSTAKATTTKSFSGPIRKGPTRQQSAVTLPSSPQVSLGKAVQLFGVTPLEDDISVPSA